MTGREMSLGVVDGRGRAEKLEVICRQQPSGAVELELRLLAWGEGVGWYSQRTIPLPSDPRDLRALLRRAERVSRKAGNVHAAAPNVVRFPGRRTELARPASA